MKKSLVLFSFMVSFVFYPFQTNAQNKSAFQPFISVGKKAIPAVVFIQSENDPPSKKLNSDYFDFFGDDFFERFFNQPMRKEPQYAAGSGCIVSKDGYILTNYHIIEHSNNIKVNLNNGDEYNAKIIGSDPRTDLAVIKIEATNLSFLEFANSDAIEIGEQVVAIGAPFQLKASLTAGVVSAKGRQDLQIADLEDYIQTDAAINPGNSGGPLLDLDAKIIGINTAIISRSGGYMGIGFAIPSNMAKHIMNQIIETGSVTRAHLGVYLQPIDKQIAEALDLEKAQGVLVSEVIKDSPADRAGLQQGDIIIAYNNIPIKQSGAFRKEIALMEPGKQITLTILRQSKQKNIVITLGLAPEAPLVNQKSTELGLEVSEIKDLPLDMAKQWNYTSDQKGVVITFVKQRSLAMQAGFKAGMLIKQINNTSISNLKDFETAMKDIDKKKNVLFLIKYKNMTKFVTIKLK